MRKKSKVGNEYILAGHQQEDSTSWREHQATSRCMSLSVDCVMISTGKLRTHDHSGEEREVRHEEESS